MLPICHLIIIIFVPNMRRKFFLIILIFALSKCFIQANDQFEILALTNKIVMLRFNEGYASYHKIGQPRNSDRVFVQLFKNQRN
jgi:hypothetical protein